jgi:Lon protease-like protein
MTASIQLDSHQDIPLFPLRVVMFPGSRLDLQIFEQRYLDMISRCMRSGTGFGICLLREGDEVVSEEGRQTIHRTGTYCSVIDWDQLDNGLLGITVEGLAKFRITDCWQGDSGVLEATVTFSEQDRLGEEAIPLDDAYAALVGLLQSLEKHPLVEQKQLTIDYDNLWDLGWRLGEFIPMAIDQKQQLLDLDDPWERISAIEQLVAEMAGEP